MNRVRGNKKSSGCNQSSKTLSNDIVNRTSVPVNLEDLTSLFGEKKAQQYKPVYMCLSHGEENALHLADIAAVTGYTPRDVKRVIQEMREGGIPICSTNDGYFIAQRKEEIDRFLGYLDLRCNSNRRVAAALRPVSNVMPDTEEEAANE